MSESWLFGELYPLFVFVSNMSSSCWFWGFCMAMALFQDSGGGWEDGMTLHFVAVARGESGGTDDRLIDWLVVLVLPAIASSDIDVSYLLIITYILRQVLSSGNDT